MHMMGKVAVWLVVIAAAASTVLTAKLVQVRNSWTKKSRAYQQQYQDLQPKIAELTDQLATLEADYFRSKQMWGLYWNKVPTTIQRPGEGVVDISIGANEGLAAKQYLYGFELLPDGKVVYRGDFTVESVNPQQSRLKPNWKVNLEDVQTWAPNGTWRWRAMIPPAYQPNFDQQIYAISVAEDKLVDRRAKLASETKLETEAQAQLAVREAELVGGDQLSKDPQVDVEYREGLVAAVEQTEELRNQVLRANDDLRRRLRKAQTGVDKLKTDNVELTRKLPQPPTTVGSAKD